MANSAPALRVQWHDDRLVGKVVVPGVTFFGYDDPWLITGHSLSPLAVPFVSTVFRQRADGFDQLPGFLSDCLPDQWGRRLMARDFRELNVNPTPMRMLAWVGNRGLGALSFAPAFDPAHSSSAWDPVTPLLLTREAQAVVQNRPPDTFRHLLQGGTAGGAYPKATVGLRRDGTLVTRGNVAAARLPGMKLGILKLDTQDDPLETSTDGRVEAAYLRMARAAGIHTTRARVMSDDATSRPRHHLFVERFDVAPRERRLHLLSLAGALHRHDLTYVDLLTATRDLTGDRAQVLEAVRRMCFNVRGGNADDHGKNHSFLFDGDSGRWTLSPAYDLTPSYSRDGGLRGLFPSTFGASPRRPALADVAAEAGVTLAEFDEIDGEVAAAVGRWAEHAGRLDVPADLVSRAARIQEDITGFLSAATPSRSLRRKRW
ncbi:MAG: type II toxin-antitoxin system HipA family toxin [Opitutus sp.]|nr:type II toxin-antitoxin system HipA family toxin [Opitutus sp.]